MAMSEVGAAKRLRGVYKDYFVDREGSADGWRIVAITHRVRGTLLAMPAQRYSSEAAAERSARAVIDARFTCR